MQETFRWSALSEPELAWTDENVHLLYGYEMSHSYSVSAVSSCQQPSSALKVTNTTLRWTFSWLKDHDLCIYKYSTVFDSSAVWFYFRLFSLWLASSGQQRMQTFLKRRTRGFNTKRLRAWKRDEKKEGWRDVAANSCPPPLPQKPAAHFGQWFSKIDFREKGRKRVETLEAAAWRWRKPLHLVELLICGVETGLLVAVDWPLERQTQLYHKALPTLRI